MNNNKAYSTKVKNLDELNQLVGNELGISKWIEVTQENISVFAKSLKMNNGYTLTKKNPKSIHHIKLQ